MAKTHSRFKHYPVRPTKLTAGFAKKEYAKLVAILPEAEKANKPDLWLKLFADWNALKSYIGSEGSRIYLKYSKNMANVASKEAEQYFREKVAPVCDEPEHKLMSAFLLSRHRPVLSKRFGEQLTVVYKTTLKPLDPVNTDLRIKTSKLNNKYEEIVGGATIKVQGRTMTLIQAGALMESPRRSIRKEAFLANRGWFLNNRLRLAKIYSELVAARHEMALRVGYENYIPLAYQEMGRTDYDQNDATVFRKNVLRYIVPLRLILLERQKQHLDVATLTPWDASYDPQTTLPLGIVPINKQLENAQRLFNKLSPRLGKHFMHIKMKGLIDLESRKNKRANAYCITFSDEGEVSILCNSTGNAYDVHTLTHEMGHAFQALESQTIEAVDLEWGTADLAEVYSTAMEFLSLKHMDYFFDVANAKKFASNRLAQSVNLICYVCVVDEFQHWVYQNPRSSFDQRDKKWIELANIYTPGIDYTGIEKYGATRWYSQGHIFGAPFYYIDYALAETAAMQLAMLADDNHSETLSKYLELCKLGGTKSFLSALRSAGLRSPFEEKLISDLIQYAKKVLL